MFIVFTLFMLFHLRLELLAQLPFGWLVIFLCLFLCLFPSHRACAWFAGPANKDNPFLCCTPLLGLVLFPSPFERKGAWTETELDGNGRNLKLPKPTLGRTEKTNVLETSELSKGLSLLPAAPQKSCPRSTLFNIRVLEALSAA